jgi:hypothetical protein
VCKPVFQFLRERTGAENKIIQTEFRSRPVGSCDASSQKGAGDALVARWFSGFPEGVKKCDEGVAATLW